MILALLDCAKYFTRNNPLFETFPRKWIMINIFDWRLLFFMIHLLPIFATSLLLAKTKESFKLLELQHLKAQLLLGDDCDCITIDNATGSSLFSFSSDISTSSNSFIKRQCDWVGKVLVRASDPVSFVSAVRSMDAIQSGWILEYARFGRKNKKTKPGEQQQIYSSKTLLTCVAQAIGSEAQLTPKKASTTLMIVDAIDAFFLVRLIDEAKSVEVSNSGNITWSKRPFQYSSSINWNMAEMIMDIIHDMAVSQMQERGIIRLLDPTCGSGTFLALGLSRGMNVQGWDINQACVDGAIRNLDLYFGDSNNQKWSVVSRDATAPSNIDFAPNCVVANVPWGVNTNPNNNAMIMQQLKISLQPQTPCAIISKSIELQAVMKRLGYKIIGFCHVPPKDFVLPTSKKKRNISSTKQNTNSHCIITIATSP